MTIQSFICYLCLIMVSVFCTGNEFIISQEQQVGVIVALKTYFRSGCIVFLRRENRIRIAIPKVVVLRILLARYVNFNGQITTVDALITEGMVYLLEMMEKVTTLAFNNTLPWKMTAWRMNSMFFSRTTCFINKYEPSPPKIPKDLRNVQESEQLVRKWKLLSAQGLSVAIVSSTVNMKCHRNRPLSVIFPNDVVSEVFNSSRTCYFTWLLFVDKEVTLQEQFAGINIPFNCEFLVAQPQDDFVIFTEIFQVSPSHPLQTYSFGNWSLELGLSSPSSGLYKRRDNLNGIVLRTGLKFESLGKQNQETELNNIRISTDFFLEYWKHLEEQINFTTEYHFPSDGAYGGKLENGSWTGVIAMLERGEVDISNVAFEMTAERSEAVDFTLPLYNVKSVMIIKRPNSVTLTWNAFLQPFSIKLWEIVILIMLLCVICMAATQQISLCTAVFLITGVFCLQGQDVSKKYASLRILMLTAYLTAVIVMACYSASFISHLTLRKPALPFRDFNEFLQDGSYELAMLPSTSRLNFFQTSKSELIKQVYKKTIAPYEKSLPIEELAGVENICTQDKYAYFISDKHLTYFGSKVSCNYEVIPGAFYPGSVAIALRKGSPYRKLFNYRVQEMRRRGLVKAIYVRYSSKLVQRNEPIRYDIDISDIAPILCTLLFGILIAFCILAIERCICRKYCMGREQSN